MSENDGPSDGPDRSDRDETTQGANLYQNYGVDSTHIICMNNSDILFWHKSSGPNAWIAMKNGPYLHKWR